MRESVAPRNRTRMRVAVLSSISDVSPAAGLTASSDSADPFQRTVIEPPDESYVFVNGAGPCGATEVELLLLDEELVELLDDVLVAGGLVGVPCPVIVGAGGVATVVAGKLDGAAVFTGAGTVVAIAGSGP